MSLLVGCQLNQGLVTTRELHARMDVALANGWRPIDVAQALQAAKLHQRRRLRSIVIRVL